MNYWFFTPFQTYVWMPNDLTQVQIDSSPEIRDANLTFSKPVSIYPCLQLNISREDLERAGYNHKRSSWSEEEDKMLLGLAKSQNLNWVQIGKKMENRNSKMCYSRYRRLCYETKKRWTTIEEATIMQWIKKIGFDWKSIAKNVPGRTARQIQQHYHFCLRPDINKSEWTIEEDLRLVGLLETYGTTWKKLEEEMPGRSQNQIKNRYFGRLMKIVAEKEKCSVMSKSSSIS